MKSYKCLINSTAGMRGTIIQLDENLQQTKQRLEGGIIAELKIEQPEEVKETKARKRKAKKQSAKSGAINSEQASELLAELKENDA